MMFFCYSDVIKPQKEIKIAFVDSIELLLLKKEII